MGLSSSGQRTTSRQTSNSTATPQLPAYMSGPVSNYFSQVGNLLNTNSRGNIAPINANLQSAFSGAQGLGNSGIGNAMGATAGLLGYSPQNVTAGQLANTDMSAYMNPYTDEVIGRSLADLERSRQGAISAGQGAATAAGAYGGSRHGVADSLTNREYMDSAGNLAAGLRQAGWNTGLGAAQFDIANRLGADQFNVNSGLAGANFRLGAANQLGNLGLAQDANSRANLGTQADLGAQERDIANQNNPDQAYMRYLAQLQSLLGLNPNALIGQNTQSTGTGTQTTTSTPSGLQILGTIAQTAGAFMSDRRLKRDIELIGPDEKGLNWYEYSYLWDEPGVRRVGVMAQEAPAHAVLVHPSGYLMVDYGAL